MHGEQSQPEVVAPQTHDAGVDEVLAGLTQVGGLSLREQAVALDEAHRRLQDRLTESDGAR